MVITTAAVMANINSTVGFYYRYSNNSSFFFFLFPHFLDKRSRISIVVIFEVITISTYVQYTCCDACVCYSTRFTSFLGLYVYM